MPKTDEPDARVNFTLPAALLERLDAEAKAEERSRSHQVRYILTRYLNKQ